jgi:hypothetical protein
MDADFALPEGEGGIIVLLTDRFERITAQTGTVISMTNDRKKIFLSE